MKKAIVFGIMLITFSQTLFGLLAPLSQSIVEIRTILDSPELTDRLKPAEIIQDIKKTDNGYLVTTNRSQLAVDITYISRDNPGPQKFKLQFQQPSIKN